ncbi:APC family permease [Pseudorhodoferax sp.]|uniref:APC family permease n=1 Tax=Pseudorhodoferax sp. TaxID=1993553 RepID=UPI002DD6526A|nr:amino acid permease [Pseudorhodoferax sp.]
MSRPATGAGLAPAARAGRSPAAPLELRHAIAITVGASVGAGIFAAPSLVAANVPSVGWMFLLWLAGGAIAFIGALCYAELSSTYASQAGEYHFLSRAFGRGTALLYAWARFSVITTGSIALLGFVYGDYMSQLLPLGPYSAALHAALATVLLTAVNMRGLRQGAQAQTGLTLLVVAGLALIIAAGLWLWLAAPATPAPVHPAASTQATSASGLGLAMVFVLLTFGGWNDAAYLSADLRQRRSIVWALLLSVGFITALYLLVNWAYWQVLGLDGMARSHAVATDTLVAAFGPAAGKLIAAMVAVAALTSMNATLIVGARTACALGDDWPPLRFLARWDAERHVPRHAMPVQCVLALLLIAVGATFTSGFQAMVEYTAPVFWLFFLLVGVALLRLRAADAGRARPFRVPLYPLLPLLFCASSAGMLWASLSFVHSQQLGGFNAAWIGVAVLGSGALMLLGMRRRERC